ncbi:MAG: acyloxyacyl hydrolase, partial [Betaproteobacteria bacterium]|nr:acyloxyacyl hydrolase [Betaproteobacteria bacterium]
AVQARAMDNTGRKNTVILAGLATNTFAISNREHLKACESQWDFGYQAGKDKKLYSDTARLGFMRCDMDTSDVLPWGIEFSVLPTGLASVWETSTGSHGSSLYEVGFVPVGQFGKAVGPVYLDASFGLGPDLISRNSIGVQRKSTLFQFTDEMAVGISDLKKRVRLSLMYRHISNLDIKLPNNGTNFVGLGLSYRFND